MLTNNPVVIQGNPAPARGSFSFPTPIRGAAGRLQGTLDVLSGCIGGAIAVAPYTPIVFIPGGMSVVKGLSAMCQQWREPTAQPEADTPSSRNMNAQGTVRRFSPFPAPAPVCLLSPQFNERVSAFCGVSSTNPSDTMKVASLVKDLTMLPLRFVAGLQPLGQKANAVVDMITDENVGLAQIHQEIITKNINNITKLTLVAAVGSGGLMSVCFLGAGAALVVGLIMVPVFCSLLMLVVLGLAKSKRTPSSPLSDIQALPSPTHELCSRSYFL